MSKTLNRRLTTTDASFLYFEKKEAPMHIGSVHLFEGEVPFEDFIAMMDAKMHLIPRYQQVVKFDPFNMAHPTWESDPHFDIRKHIFKLQIDAPGGEQELVELSSRIFTPVMERDKPLWDIFWVYGLEGGRTAMIARIHHCMVDGISGIDLIKIILDISPEIKIPIKPATEPTRTARLDPTRQFFDSLLGGMEEGMNRWMEFQNGLLNLTQAFIEQPTRDAMTKIGGDLPGMATPATILPFNRQCSGERRLVWSEFSFADVRAIRAALGGTVNDAALTILSGAVAKYVESHGQATANRSVRFMVPVSLRQDDQHGALGNLVSILPVEIPLDLPDPAERFHHIHRKTAALKGGRVAEGVSLFSALMGVLPAPVQALAGALAAMPMPAVNMVATNVPGPQVPLYTLGVKMLGYYPYVPVGYVVGCGCAILTYDQKITFGLTADVQAMPDVERLRDFLNESFAELLKAAGVEKTDAPPIKKTAPRTAAETKPPATKTVKPQTAKTVKPQTAKKTKPSTAKISKDKPPATANRAKRTKPPAEAKPAESSANTEKTTPKSSANRKTISANGSE
ncbi:MAG: wax ester/triacylglycerol synthase family O-acyltransferase [Pyrinomonadaceae bacterium]|nr:wax ester/triacylglycerol synthase family O-acyltransferase [Pyrinomonadaceae bacterium]